jgi:hypothetical protein
MTCVQPLIQLDKYKQLQIIEYRFNLIYNIIFLTKMIISDKFNTMI